MLVFKGTCGWALMVLFVGFKGRPTGWGLRQIRLGFMGTGKQNLGKSFRGHQGSSEVKLVKTARWA